MRRTQGRISNGRLPLRPMLFAKPRRSMKSAAYWSDRTEQAFTALGHPGPRSGSASRYPWEYSQGSSIPPGRGLVRVIRKLMFTRTVRNHRRIGHLENVRQTIYRSQHRGMCRRAPCLRHGRYSSPSRRPSLLGLTDGGRNPCLRLSRGPAVRAEMAPPTSPLPHT